MAKPFKTLLDKMSPEAIKAIDQKTQQLLKELPLQELRQARHLSQMQLANVLHVQQGAISKLERRTDMYVSTLRSFIKAMGGDLKIIAQFPDGEIQINQFEEVGETSKQS
ncbi:MAG: XRE family transcriptional regulator [Nitrospirae bacterium]|nr:XRE family transcriptional regulator [Nitrospirota bacterium]